MTARDDGRTDGCALQMTGAIELYFYDELAGEERRSVARHLTACAECRQVVEELTTIRDALATRPAIAAPPGGDWGAFMGRLDDAIRVDGQARAAVVVALPPRRPPDDSASASPRMAAFAPYLAIAALVTLAVSAGAFVSRHASTPAAVRTAVVAPTPAPLAAAEPVSPTVRSPEAVFTTLSEQHFERSKLVVLGLANKDPQRVSDADWAYERDLASTLLSDTRLYRMAAEERGMKTLAGVMSDLELVLLQTSLVAAPDPEALAQIQRLIDKRDLLTKMDVAAMGS